MTRVCVRLRCGGEVPGDITGMMSQVPGNGIRLAGRWRSGRVRDTRVSQPLTHKQNHFTDCCIKTDVETKRIFSL